MITTRSSEALRRARRFLSSRTFAVIAMAVVVCASMFAVTRTAHFLYVVDGTETSLALVRRGESERDILNDLDISLGEYDSVATEELGPLFSRFTIVRGISATLIVDGSETSYSCKHGTVGDLLKAQGITLGTDDYCSAPENMALSNGDVITVSRVEKKLVKERSSIAYDVEYRESSLLRNGAQQVIRAGTSGISEDTYEELWENGKLVSRTLISAKVVSQPTAQVILQGKSGAAISRLDWSRDYPLDANGIPQNYEKCYSGQRATGYSASEGTYGSSGGYCYYGTVAVDTSVYPYGTKMYIRSADGRFVYGYAIATDTGYFTGVDLFYETYRESVLNSVRNVDIYVLEWGTGRVY